MRWQFEPWRSEAEHTTSRSRRLPQYWVSHVDEEESFCFFQTAESGNRTPNSSVKGSGANHYPIGPNEELGRESEIQYLSEIWVISGNLNCLGVSYEHRQNIEQSIWPSLGSHTRNKIFDFVALRYFAHFGQTNKLARFGSNWGFEKVWCIY